MVRGMALKKVYSQISNLTNLMIQIDNKEQCVGCGACSQRCPKQCISLIKDSQGFEYAKADPNLCIECGLCEKVCPVLHPALPKMPLKVFGCYNRDRDIVNRASSGGTFEQLAKETLSENGVVFGAYFDKDWNVRHGYAETIEDVRKFSRSKYVQSIIGSSYIDAESFLKQGRKVLFSGTPCQISGLRLFLGKEYSNLIKVEVACHGVPSPMVWQNYLKSVSNVHRVTTVNFRDKRIGWEDYRVVIELDNNKNQPAVCQPVYENIYMMGFLKDLYLRPSCFSCKAKQGQSGADLTLADFWGIKNVDSTFYNQQGVSLILDYKGGMIPKNMISKEVPYDQVIVENPALVKSAVKPQGFNTFWEYYPKEGIAAVGRILDKFKKRNRIMRLLNRISTKSKNK